MRKEGGRRVPEFSGSLSHGKPVRGNRRTACDRSGPRQPGCPIVQEEQVWKRQRTQPVSREPEEEAGRWLVSRELRLWDEKMGVGG